VPMLRFVPFSDVWVPISTAKSDAYKKEYVGDFWGVFLAHSAADIPAIQEEFNSRLTQVEITEKGFNRLSSSLGTFFEAMAGELFGAGSTRAIIAGLLIGALLFMLLPTINLININVSRIMERASEIGVRKAF